MNNNLKKFGCGLLIGISNLIPGFSGGTMALILNIYEEFTADIAMFTKHPLTALKNLWAIATGMLIGIIVATFTIALCLKYFPMITGSFFTGLVIATIPLTFKNMRNRKVTFGPILSLILCMVFSIALPFLQQVQLLTIDISKPDALIIILVIIIAALAAATMMIPAASGSLILLAFGMYFPIVTLLKESLVYLKNGDFTMFLDGCIVLIPFAIGAILGIVLIAKIITYLFKNYDLIIWYGILGLLITSPFTIFQNAYDKYIKPDHTIITDHLAINIILSIVMFALGYFGLTYLMKLANKTQTNKNTEEIAC